MLSRLSQWALNPWWVSLRVWVLVCDQLGEEKKEKSRSVSEQKGPLHASVRQGLRWFRRERARLPTYGPWRTECRKLPRASTGMVHNFVTWCRCMPGLASLLPEIRAEGRVSPAERDSVHGPSGCILILLHSNIRTVMVKQNSSKIAKSI